MSTARALASTIAAALLAGSALQASTGLDVQRHLLDPAALTAVLAEKASSDEAHRSAIREALSRPEVQDAAGKAGMSLDRLSAELQTLDGADLERVGSAARTVNNALVGGSSSITLSTTTIIIGLLVLILIIVAVG
jgi:hypothetical protein